MQHIRRILVGAEVKGDPSQFTVPSQDAIARGLWLGEATGAEVTLMTVLHRPPEGKESPELVSDQDLDPAARVRNLHIALANQEAASGRHFRSVIKHGRAWQELIRAVLQENFQLVIVGTREHGGAAQRMLFGSTATKLLRKSPSPVWVTRPGAFTSASPTVIAADDFSPVGEQVLDIAVSISQLMNARLLAVHAVEDAFSGRKMPNGSGGQSKAHWEQARAEAERTLSERLSMTDARTLSQGARVLVSDALPERAIESAVAEYDADLVVMGTLGRGGIPGFLIGNTAERLLSVLRCSVLAVKPEGFVSPVPLERPENR